MKIDIISEVIIFIASILKFFPPFFATLQSMNVPHVMPKTFFYQDLRRGDVSRPIPPAKKTSLLFIFPPDGL